MPVRELRRETFKHEGRAYDIVVTDDGRCLTVTGYRDGKPLRGGRFRRAPHGWNGYASAEVDTMVDAVRQWILERPVHAWVVGPVAPR